MPVFHLNKHSISKFLIYFKDQKYWNLSKSDVQIDLSLGKYFLDLKERLYDNHYNTFDEEGIPVRMKNNTPGYNFTTICSYGLANWNMYLETKENQYFEKVELMLRFVQENATSTHYNGMVLLSNGCLCAMSQGEALSLISRAYLITKEEALVRFAEKLLKSYDYYTDENGIKGEFKEINSDWLEEKPGKPYKHILNGMIYSTIGLHDLTQAMPSLREQASNLFHLALKSLQKALPFYDRGYWSNYWYAEEAENYIASMMYHNLHICQLKYLYEITQKSEFKFYAEKFNTYQKNRFYRIRAGFELLRQKILKVS